MRTFNVINIKNDIDLRIDLRIDLTSWALPLEISHFWNYQYNMKDTQISVLCFTIRYLHMKGEKDGKRRIDG